jgi:hypothetical protein
MQPTEPPHILPAQLPEEPISLSRITIKCFIGRANSWASAASAVDQANRKFMIFQEQNKDIPAYCYQVEPLQFHMVETPEGQVLQVELIIVIDTEGN